MCGQLLNGIGALEPSTEESTVSYYSGLSDVPSSFIH